MAKNLQVAVRNRLLEIARTTGQDANLIWARYAIERLLYRLSISPHAENFILKGAMLFLARTGKPHRPTRDLDLLGFGETSEERIAEVIRSVCEIECQPDGIRFDADSIQITQIREEQAYDGRRVLLKAYIDTVRVDLQIDIGFGDAVTPNAETVEYPAMLEFPAPRIRGYPWETVIAEKVEAMVVLGLTNSRMKDFDDVRTLARLFAFEGKLLSSAIHSTFGRRKTPIPTTKPVVLTDEFSKDAEKLKQWNAYLTRNGAGDPTTLDQVIAEVRDFVLPPLLAAAGTFGKKWEAGGPWKP